MDGRRGTPDTAPAIGRQGGAGEGGGAAARPFSLATDGARPDLWMRCGYWWQVAALGCLSPFLTLYFRGLGFSGPQVGALSATMPLATALLAPAWGLLADLSGRHRALLRAAQLGAALSALLLTHTTAFTPTLATLLALACCVAPLGSLLDSFGVAIAERRGVAYGQLRVWGSFGFIVASGLVGRWMGGAVSPRFLLAYAAALLLACATTLGLPPLAARARTAGWRPRDAASILRRRPVLLLLATAYLAACGTSILYTFFGIYLTSLGGSAQALGLAFAIGASSELPMLAFGGRLLDRLGPRRLLALALALYTVRFALYGIPPAPRLVLAVQILHGLSYAAYLMATVTLMHRLAGRRLAATAQALLASVSLGFGTVTGALVGGALLDRVGAVGLFRLAAALTLAALILFLAGARRWPEGEV